MQPQPDARDVALHYLGVGRPDEARRALEPHLAEHPQDVEALRILAFALVGIREIDRAEQVAQRVLATAPDDDAMHHVLFAVARERRDLARAEEIALQALRRQPEDIDWMNEYAWMLLLNLHMDTSQKWTRKVLALDPTNESALRRAAIFATLQGSTAERNAAIETLVRESPDSAGTLYVLTLDLVRAGRVREARRLAEELVRIDPTKTAFHELVTELRVQSHWFAWPAWPQRKFGMTGALVVYVIGVGGAHVLGRSESPLYLPWLSLYLGWVVHSWIYQRVLRRWQGARAR